MPSVYANYINAMALYLLTASHLRPNKPIDRQWRFLNRAGDKRLQ